MLKQRFLYVKIQVLVLIQVIWSYKNGRILTTNEKVQGNRRKFQLSYEFNEWNLQISNVRKTDSGEYKCQVNSNPVQTKTAVLVVSGELVSRFYDPTLKWEA